jgi:hypothetical protein
VTHIQQRRGLASEWTTANPVLLEGEAGHETDTGKWKLGDGSTAWTALPYKSDVDSVAGKTGVVTLEVADVAGAAPLASPVFTGNPTAPTPATTDDDTSLATTAFVKNVVGAAGHAPIESPAFTGNPTAPTPDLADDDTSIATTGFVKDVVAGAEALLAPLASPVFTGNPTAPTPAATDDDTSLATTGFVKDAILQHTGSGSRLNDPATSQPSQPLGLRVVTGRVGGNTDSTGLLPAVFPGGGFTNAVLYVAATTLSGSAINPVVNAGAVSLTQCDFIWPGVASTTIAYTYIAIGF